MRDQYRARYRRRLAGRRDLHADHWTRLHGRLQFDEPRCRNSWRIAADFRAPAARSIRMIRARLGWVTVLYSDAVSGSVMSHTVALYLPLNRTVAEPCNSRQTRR